MVLPVTCLLARNFPPTQRRTFCDVPGFPAPIVDMDPRYTVIPGMCAENGFADLSQFLRALHMTCLLASKLFPTRRHNTLDVPALCVASAPVSHCPFIVQRPRQSTQEGCLSLESHRTRMLMTWTMRILQKKKKGTPVKMKKRKRSPVMRNLILKKTPAAYTFI